MPEYRVAVPMRTRGPEGQRHEGTTFYTIKSHTPELAKLEAERQAKEYLRQQQVTKSIVGWYIYSDKIEAHNANRQPQ